jgi:S1-C subfamily serine protease
LRRRGDNAVQVAETLPGGAAALAGIIKGDVILDFAGDQILTVDDLHRLLTDGLAERETPISVLRAGGIKTLNIRPERE